ncbi:hypothetical protein ACFQS3_17325 [Glycomyces mayteni]|uniref:ScoMcrA-like SRA domain-containing protein n=1 Tax=Glycomyces mayteni TaxID=543887 RepID=A0ABW2D9G8_9ACTN|nr:hypothetical protein GCM10025732_20950 [Glycomyces mayteni]
MTEDNKLAPGQTFTRIELSKIFGGALYSGIVPSNTTPNVLLYSDASKGEANGYFDSFAIEDDHGPLFHYTGEGRTGPQKMTNGNKAILNHVKDGRALHLFWAVGKLKGSDTRLHQYVGQFEIDPVKPYFTRTSPDKDGNSRTVIVFRLRAVNSIKKPSIDYMTVPVQATYTEVHDEPVHEIQDPATSRLIETERNSGITFVRNPSAEAVFERREGALVDRFKAFLESQSHEAKRWLVSPAGIRSGFQTDIFDVTDHVLYEAKGQADRNSIRMAIGQLLDYQRSIEPRPTLAVLLPEAPLEDLQQLLKEVGIGLVYEQGAAFIGWPASLT